MSTLDRRSFVRLSTGAVATGAAYSAMIMESPAQAAPAAGSGDASATPAKQFRALWIASVENIDFPSRTGLSAAAQKKEFEAWMDLAVRLNLNAVISQVRPCADAFWPSRYEPWSQYLTGTQGKDPGYDPLGHQVKAAHDRGLEYHAWFNPYRVSNQADPAKLVASHPARRHPDWVFAFGGKLYYNPGMPEVRRFVEDAMLDAVRRYDIDAVHFDDYFYPYPVEGQEVPDDAAYRRYGNGASKEDWRRENVNILIREMRQRMRACKPWVKLGISPFGIWRNKTSDPAGSDTSGSESYTIISADTRRWVTSGWVDYVCPQIYWEIGHPKADYAALVRWWADLVKDTGVALYIGQATYKITSKAFTDPRELTRHLELNATLPTIDGDAYFSARDMRNDPQGAVSALVKARYSRPALVPALPSAHGCPPPAPRGVAVHRGRGGTEISWTRRHRDSATRYAIWRLSDPVANPEALADARNLVAIVPAVPGRARQRYVDRSGARGGYYVVTAYDRLFNESRPSRGRRA